MWMKWTSLADPNQDTWGKKSENEFPPETSQAKKKEREAMIQNAAVLKICCIIFFLLQLVFKNLNVKL